MRDAMLAAMRVACVCAFEQSSMCCMHMYVWVFTRGHAHTSLVTESDTSTSMMAPALAKRQEMMHVCAVHM